MSGGQSACRVCRLKMWRVWGEGPHRPSGTSPTSWGRLGAATSRNFTDGGLSSSPSPNLLGKCPKGDGGPYLGLQPPHQHSFFLPTNPLAIPNFPPYRPPSLTLNWAETFKCALRLSVRTTAFHVVKTGSTPVGRTIFSPLSETFHV
jgi:hypothetical protein